MRNTPFFPVYLLAVFLALPAFTGFTQTDTVHIRPLVELIDLGRSGEVKVILPTLTADHPADPGIRFLNAVFDPDADRAVQVFREVVRDFPSTYAGEASARRLVLYYTITGNQTEQNRYREYLKSRGLPAEATAVRPVSVATPAPAKPKTPVKGKDPVPVKADPVPPPVVSAPPAEKSDPLPTVNPKGHFFIQVGAFALQNQANKGLKDAEKAGFKGKVKKEITNNRIYYKVRLGPYDTQAAARQVLPAISKKLGLNGFVVEE